MAHSLRQNRLPSAHHKRQNSPRHKYKSSQILDQNVDDKRQHEIKPPAPLAPPVPPKDAQYIDQPPPRPVERMASNKANDTTILTALPKRMPTPLPTSKHKGVVKLEKADQDAIINVRQALRESVITPSSTNLATKNPSRFQHPRPPPNPPRPLHTRAFTHPSMAPAPLRIPHKPAHHHVALPHGEKSTQPTIDRLPALPLTLSSPLPDPDVVKQQILPRKRTVLEDMTESRNDGAARGDGGMLINVKSRVKDVLLELRREGRARRKRLERAELVRDKLEDLQRRRKDGCEE